MSLEATASGINSDSYATIAEADLYHSAHLYSSSWVSASLANKEIALKMATRILDEKVKWNGVKTNETQALNWGRSNVKHEGFDIDENIVPKVIKNATAEFARHLLTSDSTVEAQGKGLESLEVGSIKLSFDKNDVAEVVPVIVQAMIEGWGRMRTKTNFGAVSLVRA
jgi:hypothetical protein